MNLNILHLNIERNKHIDAVRKLLEDKKPDVVCFEEAMHSDVEKIAKDFGYELIFAPLLDIKSGDNKDGEGPAILAKYKILKTEKYKYGDNQSVEPVHEESEIVSRDGKRPSDRFLYNYTLLIANIELPENKIITISTTHFPVVDHSTPGLGDHELDSIRDIDEVEHSKKYLENLLSKIRTLNVPLIFTSDLNNARGEYVYDTLAHELVDIVPKDIISTLDPSLHYRPGLKLVVDTIMTSPNISLENFEIIEGVSDHKALLASFNI